MKTTTATTWAAPIAVLLVLLAVGTAPASNGLLSANSLRGKNTLDGGLCRASAAVTGGTPRACAEFCPLQAADPVVAPSKVGDFSKELTRDRANATKSLRNALGTNSQIERPHHIIPWEAKDLPVVQAAARGGFNINGMNNGIKLSLKVHGQGVRHPQYNAAVIKELEALGKRKLTDAQAAAKVQALADRLRPGLERLNKSGRQLK